jgi:PmbA protein
MKKEACQQIFDQITSIAKVDHCECMIRHVEENLTRFANSAIHQNVNMTKSSIHLRLIKGKKSGYASGNDLSSEGLSYLTQQAQSVLENNEEDAQSYELPHPEMIPDIPFKHYDESEAFDHPEVRAHIVNTLCKEAEKNQVNAFGSMSCARNALFIANTHGVSAFHRSTIAELSAQMMQGNASGFAQSTATMIDHLETERVLEDSLWACLNSSKAKSIEAKAYEVILKPEAVEDILKMLNYMGFSTNAILENRSFLSGKEGMLVLDPSISISDNALDPRQLPLPFDFEGAPKQIVPIIENGVFKQMVTDAKFSKKLSKPNTGHALPAPNPMGPIPLHLVLEGKEQHSLDSMISNCKEGLLITRFWYANPANPKKGIATGLTRDGTFLIKNGKIEHAVNNMRYTDSLVDVLSRIIAIGDTPRLHDMTLAPALHCASMKFTGQASS